jgi:hypothetical protein
MLAILRVAVRYIASLAACASIVVTPFISHDGAIPEIGNPLIAGFNVWFFCPVFGPFFILLQLILEQRTTPFDALMIDQFLS